MADAYDHSLAENPEDDTPPDWDYIFDYWGMQGPPVVPAVEVEPWFGNDWHSFLQANPTEKIKWKGPNEHLWADLSRFVVGWYSHTAEYHDPQRANALARIRHQLYEDELPENRNRDIQWTEQELNRLLKDADEGFFSGGLVPYVDRIVAKPDLRDQNGGVWGLAPFYRDNDVVRGSIIVNSDRMSSADTRKKQRTHMLRTILHEGLHQVLITYGCKCQGCFADWKRLVKTHGHGPVWFDLAKAIGECMVRELQPLDIPFLTSPDGSTVDPMYTTFVNPDADGGTAELQSWAQVMPKQKPHIMPKHVQIMPKPETDAE